MQAIVRINDRLPQNSKRIIDLSKGVAQHLDMVNDGIVDVKLSLLSASAVEWLRDQYKSVPHDIRLRSYYPEISVKKDEQELAKIKKKVF